MNKGSLPWPFSEDIIKLYLFLFYFKGNPIVNELELLFLITSSTAKQIENSAVVFLILQ